MKDQKYNYRMRDLYVTGSDNSLILLPDWRVRSEDRLPKFEFYMGNLKHNKQKKEYEKLKNDRNKPITEFVIDCQQDMIRKYVKSQADNPNFKVSPSVRVPRAKKRETGVSSLKIEESYTEKMTRLDIEKFREEKILEKMLQDRALIEQGTEFINQMKRKKSMLLEKAIRLSTMQSTKKQADGPSQKKVEKQATLDASSLSK